MKDYIYSLIIDLDEVHTSNPELISEFKETLKDPFSEDLANRSGSLKLDPNVIELYQAFNGVYIDWTSDDQKGIGGRMNLLPLEQVLQNWEGKLYDKDDVPEDADIRFFYPIDLVSDEAQCGIIIDPSSDARLVGYNYSGETDIQFLGVDFKGYIEMALEARVFRYWPLVLLDIKNNTESEELIMFKEYMPRIFKDFDFNAFADKYNSLRG